MPRNRHDWPGMCHSIYNREAQVKYHLVFAAVVAASFVCPLAAHARAFPTASRTALMWGRRRPVRSAQWLAELLAASLAASMACSASIRSRRRRRCIVAGIISGICTITTVTDTRPAKTRPRRPGRSVKSPTGLAPHSVGLSLRHPTTTATPPRPQDPIGLTGAGQVCPTVQA